MEMIRTSHGLVNKGTPHVRRELAREGSLLENRHEIEVPRLVGARASTEQSVARKNYGYRRVSCWRERTMWFILARVSTVGHCCGMAHLNYSLAFFDGPRLVGLSFISLSEPVQVVQ